ncbi:hypothetical protein Ais01nite_47120 [Asanoa ishikariensis]|uniref:Three-Cys-motif partner protein n=1 Tax=Asanoa ishikariensis TaxID=137265 RepID=A0A1H3RYK6_9ACTN|nr:hypothetical protein [Asanoa ishikariensis]GIF66677.1 hypothetical protein Ais01nite_47120 [Asanoa ishikariensis]SDZ30826.1 hypothetical protein SAMN05421684_4370 [Asanoa ishikariensis]
MGGPIDDVVREILVRQLDAWGPAALHRSKRATFAQAYGGPPDGLPEAALRVFDEFTDLLRGRRLTAPVIAPSPDRAALDAVYQELDRPSGLDIHAVDGGVDTLPAVLTAASAAGAPLLAFLDAATGPPSAATLAAVARGKPGELLLVLAEGFREHRAMLSAAGFPLVADVELVARDGSARLVVFATGSGKSLDTFKDAMWAVDEYAGVRYRDPHDPEGHLLDISERPHPGPLRRELLAHLAEVGRATVTELRQFTVTDTVYRAGDANRVLTTLLNAGQVTRDPPAGRLGGDVVISSGG